MTPLPTSPHLISHKYHFPFPDESYPSPASRHDSNSSNSAYHTQPNALRSDPLPPNSEAVPSHTHIYIHRRLIVATSGVWTGTPRQGAPPHVRTPHSGKAVPRTRPIRSLAILWPPRARRAVRWAHPIRRADDRIYGTYVCS